MGAQAARPPTQTYVVHGEPDAADALRCAIRDRLGWTARVPGYGEIAQPLG
jgi:metallo-beta-lactamase family protein